MPEKRAGSLRRVRVPVSLRSRDRGHHQFVADCEIELVDGIAAPILREGRRYAFTHVLRGGRYGSALRDEIYVFTEAAPLG
jgi:hypothetical protein